MPLSVHESAPAGDMQGAHLQNAQRVGQIVFALVPSERCFVGLLRFIEFARLHLLGQTRAYLHAHAHIRRKVKARNQSFSRGAMYDRANDSSKFIMRGDTTGRAGVWGATKVSAHPFSSCICI